MIAVWSRLSAYVRGQRAHWANAEPVDVLHRAHRQTRRGVGIGALLLCACLLAGCASPIRGGAGPTTHPTSSAEATDPGQAGAVAARLLSLVTVPPHARAFTSADGISGGTPLGQSADPDQVVVERRWHVPLSLAAAQAFVAAHAPAGLVTYGTSTGDSGPDIRDSGIGYSDGTGSLAFGQLQIGLSSRGGTTSDMWADAVVTWQNPATPPALDTAAGPRLRITVGGGCPRSDATDVGVVNSGSDLTRALLPKALPTGALECDYHGTHETAEPFLLASHALLGARAAAALATQVRGLSLIPLLGPINCPADFRSATVYAFRYRGRPDVDLWQHTSGCGGDSNGFIVSAI